MEDKQKTRFRGMRMPSSLDAKIEVQRSLEGRSWSNMVFELIKRGLNNTKSFNGDNI